MMRKTCFRMNLIAICILLSGKSILANGNAGRAGAFLRIGIGARALAMGGGFSAVSDDPTAAYWNPAGISQIRHLQLYAMYARLSLDRQHNFVSAIIPSAKGTFGISWIGFGVSEIEARTSNSIQPDYIFSDSENAFIFSFAENFDSDFSIGANCKLLYHKLDNRQALGFGLDIAFMAKFWDFLKLGLVFQDIGSNLKWSGGHKDFVPSCTRMGISFNLMRNLLIAADLIKMKNGKPDIHWGIEYKPLKTFPIRIGTDNNGALSMGAGLEVPLQTKKVALDYCYSKDSLDNGSIHKISITFSFGSNCLPEIAR